MIMCLGGFVCLFICLCANEHIRKPIFKVCIKVSVLCQF